MTDVKKITEGIYAYKDPNAEIKRRLEEDSQNKLLFSYDEDNSLSGLMNDADLINELSQAQNELCATNIEDLSTLYSEYDNEIKETKATINEYDNTYSYDNTRLESLENTRNEIISDISKNKEDLNAVFNGEHPEVAAAQNSLNDAQDEYLKALDESNNPEIMALYDSIEENNLNIMEQEATIAYITQQITDTESQISAQESAISSLDSEISSYESQISSLQSMLSSCDNDSQEVKIRSRISNLESLKANAQARKTNEETILETLQEKLESLEEQKPKEEEKLELFKEKQNELEEQIKSIQDETINAALENLQNARQNLADIKEELVSKIQESIENADAELKKTEEQIAKLKKDERFFENLASTCADKYFTNEQLNYRSHSFLNKFNPQVSTLELYLNFTLRSIDNFKITDRASQLIVDMLRKAFQLSKCILNLLIDGFETEAFSTWRTLHENECILICLIKNGENIFRSYFKHIQYALAYRNQIATKEETDKIFEEIKKEMKEHELKSKDMKKFIEYGYLFAIPNLTFNEDFKLNFRDGIQKVAGLSSYSKTYEMSSEISHSSPLLLFSNKQYYFIITLLNLYETFFRLEKIFQDSYILYASEANAKQYALLKNRYMSQLLYIYKDVQNQLLSLKRKDSN